MSILETKFEKNLKKNIFNFYETWGIPYFGPKNTIPSVENCIKCNLTPPRPLKVQKSAKMRYLAVNCGMITNTKNIFLDIFQNNIVSSNDSNRNYSSKSSWTRWPFSGQLSFYYFLRKRFLRKQFKIKGIKSICVSTQPSCYKQ